ncbi:MAG: universal stress protein [Spirochaetia bacterium]|jgi:nucleotide-binding universal stress UspA family protein|nr:universal stress protein [Spirochaetia bacterium]
MYKILVTTDGSEQSAKTIEEAAKVAIAMNAEVTVLSVIENADNLNYASNVPQDIMLKLKKEQAAFYDNAVESAKKIFETKGLKVKTAVKHGSPVENICSVADKEKHDLIIIGRRRLSKFQGFFLGSVSSKVLQYAKTNVMVVK